MSSNIIPSVSFFTTKDTLLATLSASSIMPLGSSSCKGLVAATFSSIHCSLSILRPSMQEFTQELKLTDFLMTRSTAMAYPIHIQMHPLAGLPIPAATGSDDVQMGVVRAIAPMGLDHN